MSQLVKRATIDELCAHRARALEAFGQVYDAASAAMLDLQKAAPSALFSMPEAWRGSPVMRIDGSREDWMKKFRVAVDRSVWQHLISVGQFETLMDHTAREQFRKQLADNPPEATPENCYATMENLFADSAKIFQRGIVTAFAGLDRRFRSHDGFKIGSRIILTGIGSRFGGVGFGTRSLDALVDVERAFLVLDGKAGKKGGDQGDEHVSISHKARMATSYSRPTCDVENEYFRLKVHGNGNGHLWFKRDDLVGKVNRILADYYGAALGDANADPKHRNRAGHTDGYSLFPTPESLARDLLDRASCYKDSPRVLEPSAGTGALVRAVHEGARGQPAITAIEIQSHLADGLARLPSVVKTMCRDFLDVTPDETGQFDFIVMNPPWDMGRDVDHVLHALRFLAPGGKLAAIVAASTEFREDKRTVAFRKALEPYNPQWFDCPAGAFKESGTMANAAILILRSREEDGDQ